MINTQELLCYLLETVQLDQHLLSVAILSASSHGLKSVLRHQLAEFDRIESEIQTVAGCRGWDLPELEPTVRWSYGIRFRICVRNRDSRIAQRLVYHHTADRICYLRTAKLWDRADHQAQLVFQKLLDSTTYHIRQLELHL